MKLAEILGASCETSHSMAKAWLTSILDRCIDLNDKRTMEWHVQKVLSDDDVSGVSLLSIQSVFPMSKILKLALVRPSQGYPAMKNYHVKTKTPITTFGDALPAIIKHV